MAKNRPATAATARISLAEVPLVGSDGGIALESKVTLVSSVQAEVKVFISFNFQKDV